MSFKIVNNIRLICNWSKILVEIDDGNRFIGTFIKILPSYSCHLKFITNHIRLVFNCSKIFTDDKNRFIEIFVEMSSGYLCHLKLIYLRHFKLSMLSYLIILKYS